MTSKNRKIKEMSKEEFKNQGYLQELNRLFLHPLGVALGIKTEKNEIVDFIIIDNTQEKDGMIFESLDDKESREKAINIKKLFKEKRKNRLKTLKYIYQPIKGLNNVKI